MRSEPIHAGEKLMKKLFTSVILAPVVVLALQVMPAPRETEGSGRKRDVMS
jgi:hypothetical protein